MPKGIYPHKKLTKGQIKKRTETRRKNGWWKNPEQAKENMGKSRKGIKVTWGDKISIGRLKRKERLGYLNSTKTRRRMSKLKKEFFKKHPEKHPNYICGQNGFISKPQYELYLLVKSKFPEAELEYPIQTKYSLRFADIAIPSLKLDIEYDGGNWHNKKLDDLRDKHLKEIGWKTIRFKEDINLCLNKLNKILEVKNDDGSNATTTRILMGRA